MFHSSGNAVPKLMRIEAYINKIDFEDANFFPVIITNSDSIDNPDCAWIFYPAKQDTTYSQLIQFIEEVSFS